MTNIDIFDLTPEEFHQQEEAERRAAQEARDAKARAEREAAEAAERKKAAVAAEHGARWKRRLTKIGECADLPYEVRVTDNEYRPCELFVAGIRVPVSDGCTQRPSVEISLPWYTARWNPWGRKREQVESCRSYVKRDGSLNYEALGAMAAKYSRVERAHREAEANKSAAAGLVTRLKEDLPGVTLEPSTEADRPVQFKLTIDRAVTEADARRMWAALKLAGIIKGGK